MPQIRDICCCERGIDLYFGLGGIVLRAQLFLSEEVGDCHLRGRYVERHVVIVPRLNSSRLHVQCGLLVVMVVCAVAGIVEPSR